MKVYFGTGDILIDEFTHLQAKEFIYEAKKIADRMCETEVDRIDSVFTITNEKPDQPDEYMICIWERWKGETKEHDVCEIKEHVRLTVDQFLEFYNECQAQGKKINFIP